MSWQKELREIIRTGNDSDGSSYQPSSHAKISSESLSIVSGKLSPLGKHSRIENRHQHSAAGSNANTVASLRLEEHLPNIDNQQEHPATSSNSNSVASLRLEEHLPNNDNQQGSVQSGSAESQAQRPPKKRKKPQHGGGMSRAKKRRKEARNRGEAYITSKGKLVPSKNEPTPLSKCRSNCMARVPYEEAKLINSNFWEIGDYNIRSTHLAGLITIMQKKSMRFKNDQSGKKQKNRQYSHTYHLSVKGLDVSVCKQCFIKVLRVSPKAIEIAASHKLCGSGSVKTDERGSSIPANTLSEEMLDEVVNHIKSFPAYESHYSRSKTDKKFLPSHLDLNIMYKLYKLGSAKPVSRWSYEREFHKLGLSFKPPKIDTCKTCDRLAVKISNERDEIRRKELETELEDHHKRWRKAVDAKINDTKTAKEDPKKRVITFDMQQCLPTPMLTTSVVYYKRQLWTYNLTIHDNVTKKSTNYMWHEGIGGKGSNQVGSALLHYIDSLPPEVNEITTYSDTCGGQNKNSTISAAFLCALQRKPTLKVINQKFMVSGHSHMECDQDHSVIEGKKKTTPVIHVPRDYYNMVRSCGKRFSVVVMERRMHLDLKPLLKKDKDGPLIKRKKDVSGAQFLWKPVCWLRYSRNLPLGVVEFKTSLDEGNNFQRLDMRRAKGYLLPRLTLKHAYHGPNPINPKKKKDLLELLEFIDPECHAFYQNLPTDASVNNVDPDLYSSDEEDDAELF